METHRAFAKELSSRSAAEVRRDVSRLFTEETDGRSLPGGGVGSLKKPLNSQASLGSIYKNVEPEIPIDYELTVVEKKDELLADPEKHLVLFPEDDVEVFTVPRVHRTVKVPVPGEAKECADLVVQECVQGFMADWHSIKRKNGSFYGSDSQTEQGGQHSSDYLKELPSHEYEVDIDKQEVFNKEKRASRVSNTSGGNDEFDSVESDEILEDLMPPVVDQEQMDFSNQEVRKDDHYTKLFGLCSMPNHDKTTRTPAPLPQEQHGLNVLVDVVDLKLDVTFEPIFAELALYDVKERKKISESFHMDTNSREMYHMLDDHNGERSMASLSHKAIFSITHQHPDIFLVIKLEKVLQKGDITEAAEPYQRDMDQRMRDKAKAIAKQYCQQLGQYRMPLAWVAVALIDIIKTKGQSSSSSFSDRGGPGDRHSVAVDSPASHNALKKKDSYLMATEGEGSICTDNLLNTNFSTVTLTVQKFFKQESDKLAEDDLYRYLADMKKGTLSTLSKKLKVIPGFLKLDISPPYSNIPFRLTSNLWQVKPCEDTNRSPAREIEEFSPKPMYYPNTVYKNLLYIYPQSLDFRNSKGRNIGIKIQFMAGEDPLGVIYGRSSGPKVVKEAWATVLYHNKNPEYYNEIKIEMPPQLTTKHHILFTFYHISCMKPRPHEPGLQEPQFLGCTWIPLLEDGELQTGSYHLPVVADKLPPGYSQLKTDVKSNYKWMENHKPLFKVSTHAISSVHPQDRALSKFFKYFLEHQYEMGTEQEEKELSARILELRSASSEPLVQFLHPVLNGLFSILVRQTFSREAAIVHQSAFTALAQIVYRIQTRLDLPQDKHGHNILLASYLQHVLVAPVGHPLHSSRNKSATMAPRSGSSPDKEKKQYPGSVKLSYDEVTRLFQMDVSSRADDSSSRMFRKLLHEEITLMWLVSLNSMVRESSMSVAWFFFGAMIKSMAQHLHDTGNLMSPRKDLFPSKYHNDLQILIDAIALEVVEKHLKRFAYVRTLNTSVGFFLMDAFSLMDRGFICFLIRSYVRKFVLAQNDYNLIEFKLDLFRIICSHEYYVPLNLPLLPTFDIPSPTSNGLIEEDEGPSKIESMVMLTQKFCQNHYLTGLMLSELAHVLGGRMAKLRDQAVELMMDLFASHDADPRYQSPASRERIAMLYMPLLSIVMDNLANLYHGNEGKDDWASSFEKKIDIRQSVIIKDNNGSSSASKNAEARPTTPTNLQQLGPESTNSLLLCFLWVLHNIDPTHLCHWWSTLSSSRLNTLLSVLDLCVACFEYKGKNSKGSQSSLSNSRKQRARNSLVRNQLAGMILDNTGVSGAERIHRRRVVSVSPSVGSNSSIVSRTSSLDRWSNRFSVFDNVEKKNSEIDCLIEGCLAGETSLIVLDTVELLMDTVKGLEDHEVMQATLPKALDVLLRLLACNESVSIMEHIFATQRSVVVKFPNLLLEEEMDQCAKLCVRLLKHCSSALSKIRTLACASLYLLMRETYIRGTTFPRVKVQVTVALSSIVASSLKFDEYHLRRSLRTLVTYADSDSLTEVEGSDFPEQVRDLAANLHGILMDTVKMQEAHEDPAVLMDLMYRISKGYQNSPDLRLTWLQHMAQKHSERQNFPEAAMCLVHAAALVAEYLYLIESKSYLPVGCVTFERISPNVLEESAISEDDLSPEEEGMCTSDIFSEEGMVGLLEQAVELFKEARLYEVVYEVYQIIIPVYAAKRQFRELEKVHVKLSECFQNIVAKGDKRGFGTYFRVGFYGSIFGESIDEHNEFIYREQGLTRLAEFSLKLEKSYCDKYGSENIVMVKDSNKVQVDQLDPNKGYIQITYLEPYFDEYELALPKRSTLFDRSFNIRRFVYRTPFTKSGKARGDISDQYMRKTILTTEEHFPYVRTRIKVWESKEIILTPVEVAIGDMRDKIKKLREVIYSAPDTKLLQMQLQGGIATSVNQGPYAIAHAFLGIVPASEQNHFHRQLRMCFREFAKLCGEALSINKGLIQEEQEEYQREMERKYQDFKELLFPLTSTGMKLLPRKTRETNYLRKIATLRASRASSS